MLLISIVVILVILLLYYYSRSIEDDMLTGFWCADPSFCQVAELEMFVLYLGDNISYNIRPGYLLAANSSGIILNNPINLHLSKSVSMPYINKEVLYDANIDWLDTPLEDESTFPSELQMAYYPKAGKLVLYDGDEIVASLWKDNQMSSLKQETIKNEEKNDADEIDADEIDADE